MWMVNFKLCWPLTVVGRLGLSSRLSMWGKMRRPEWRWFTAIEGKQQYTAFKKKKERELGLEERCQCNYSSTCLVWCTLLSLRVFLLKEEIVAGHFEWCLDTLLKLQSETDQCSPIPKQMQPVQADSWMNYSNELVLFLVNSTNTVKPV